MSNGQFLQTLTCVRLNNQNGLGTEASLLASAAGKLTNAFSEEYENNSKRQLDESLKNEARKKIVQGIDKIEDYIK
jgi:adhesin HecA-like repeat protein